MATTNAIKPCPVCNEKMETYQETKPHDYIAGECLHCGFFYYTHNGFLTREDLEARRGEMMKEKGHTGSYTDNFKETYVEERTLKRPEEQVPIPGAYALKHFFLKKYHHWSEN